ncbi:MAG TPA: phenylalanine 4-monooxygenase [Candidatus Aquilonibacter sp.]|nr:phenylalanine 4-monooxygenase [Candidatus Aquilonibacter sp.]
MDRMRVIEKTPGSVAPLVAAGPYLSEQQYEGYTAEQHAVWAELVRRRRPQLEAYACREYLDGYDFIGIENDRLPNLTAISARLKPRTAWSTTPVSGFLPSDAFFEMLDARMFPTTTWLRSRESLAYTPEPDIFHDVFGHVPMHAHRVFADFLQHYGSVCARIKDPETLERLGRLFWYTVEFGLIREKGSVKIYGSGVISSHGECTNVIDGGCQVKDFDLDEVLNTPVKVDRIHQMLFAIDSFDQVYEAMHEAEKRVLPRS